MCRSLKPVAHPPTAQSADAIELNFGEHQVNKTGTAVAIFEFLYNGGCWVLEVWRSEALEGKGRSLVRKIAPAVL